jgi:hypothetical protein
MTVRREATSLGPFLTLLVLTASRRTTATQDRLAGSKTAPVETTGEQAEGRQAIPRTPATQFTLGPFLTLILTLHGGKGIDSRAWRQSSFTWPAAPFVRIDASG